ncbi:MAG TPA: DUF2723 domain-containing protein [Verrucomicrobiae bacterium]|nr:DUF2723 domain-containing protein [Verrucomicrobiae bacterium]
MSFVVTAFLALFVYWFSLPPELTLGYTGAYATNCLYPGPSVPPGNPVWVLYGWLFIKVIPFSNVAWRLSLASAVAAAVTCGLVALLVARTASLASADSPGFKSLSARTQKIAALICGTVAGLGFGLATSMWSKAVRPDPYTFSLLLFALALCLATHWFFRPACKRSIALSFFTGSLTMVENKDLCPMVLGLCLLIVLAERKFSRDALLCTSVILWWMIWRFHHGYNEFIYDLVAGWGPLFFIAAAMSFALGTAFWWKSGKIFSEWKTLLLIALMFLAAQGSYLLLPVYSMTVSPMDWGHPRTVEGFFHVNHRDGCGPQIVHDPLELSRRAGMIFMQTGHDYGWIYLFAAALGATRWRKTSSPVQRWQMGLLLAWFIPAGQVLMTMHDWMLNMDISSTNTCCTASYLPLAVFSGFGLMRIVSYCAKSEAAMTNELGVSSPTPSPSPQNLPHPPHSTS